MNRYTRMVMDPPTAWLLTNPGRGHILYPYTNDRRLLDAVGFYASDGLASGKAVILIVTEAHRLAIRRYRKADGNQQYLETNGQLSFLNAVGAMKVFLVDGDPDPKLFEAATKKLVTGGATTNAWAVSEGCFFLAKW